MESSGSYSYINREPKMEIPKEDQSQGIDSDEVFAIITPRIVIGESFMR